jgi:hypothetical protein
MSRALKPTKLVNKQKNQISAVWRQKLMKEGIIQSLGKT